MSLPVRSEPPKELILREWVDEEGFPRREISVGSVECPDCGEEIELTAESDTWEEQQDGSLKIAGDGPGMGECEVCALLFGETDMDGTVSVFDAPVQEDDPEPVRDPRQQALEFGP